jgi:DNA-binding HxlR family transcriptional regulator
MQILSALFNGAKGVQDVQEAVGGSYTKIYKSLGELNESGLITDEFLMGPDYFKTSRNKHWFQITKEGQKLVEGLLSAGFLQMPALKKDRQKWIILILNSLDKVVGRTRFMKILFLYRHEPGLWKGSYFRFKAAKFGPSSNAVLADIRELENSGFIKEDETLIGKDEFSEEEKVRYTYTLTPRGKALVPELLAECPPSSKRKIERLKPFNQMLTLELLRYVYTRYPEFIVNSVIVEKVLGYLEKDW